MASLCIFSEAKCKMTLGIDLLFFLTFFEVTLFLILVGKLIVGKFLNLSIHSVFFLYYLTFSFSGSILLYFGLDEQSILLGATDKTIILSLFQITVVTILFVFLGFFFAKNVLGLKIKRDVVFEPQLKSSLTSWQIIFIFLAFILSTYVFYSYLGKLDQIPIFVAFDGFDAKLARSLATNDFQGKYHRYAYFFDTLLPFLAIVLTTNFARSKKVWVTFFSFGVVLLALFASIVTTMKAKFVWLILSMLLGYSFSKGSKIKCRHVVLICLACLILLIPMYFVFMGLSDRGLNVVLSGIFHRIFVGSLMPGYFYLDYFSNNGNFLLGASLPNPMGIFPWQHVNISQLIMNYMAPYLSDRGIVGSAPTAFWGEAYANWGIIGTIIISFLVGVFLYANSSLVSRMNDSVLKHALRAYLTTHYMALAVSGFSGFLLDFPLLIVLVTTMVLVSIRKCEIYIRESRNPQRS